jgi:hypothetical protein
VFAATVVPMILAEPAFDVSIFDDEARIAESAVLHDQSPDWVANVESKYFLGAVFTNELIQQV